VLRPCLRPGCPELVPAGYCARHAPASSLRQADATTRGYGHRWTDLSAAYRRTHPICECCGRRPTALVHHRDGLGPHGPRGYDTENLIAICRHCHTQAHRQLANQGVGTRPGTPNPTPPRQAPQPHPRQAPRYP
jgi:5-methylcytosine-specific restriction enzyme A